MTINFNELDRVWIAAEIGVNHEGDVKVAEDLVRMAADAGADSVKFQTFTPEQYVSTVQPERLERVKRFALSNDDFRRLAKLATSLGLTFFSTPLHNDDIDFLNEIAPIFKVSSGDLTHTRMIRHMAAKNKPIIISTGMGSREEIQAAVDAVLSVRPDAGGKGELALLHCVAAYPTQAEEANLGNIRWMEETFGLPVGFSDHTLGIKACELAVAAGARILEKHFTYRKEDQAFHDHAISADPKDLKELVQAVRVAETYVGRRERVLAESEVPGLKHLRRSLAAAVEIPAGVPVKEEWVTLLRPAWGLLPDDFDSLVGKKLTRAVPAGDIIRAEDVQN